MSGGFSFIFWLIVAFVFSTIAAGVIALCIATWVFLFCAGRDFALHLISVVRGE
jgi:hypothetical protein